MASSADSPELADAIVRLDELVKGEVKDLQALITQLSIIRAECDKGVNYKVLAGIYESVRNIYLVIFELVQDEKVLIM